MPVIRVCSNNSKKYVLSSKNGLKSDVHGVCSENVYPLEDTCCLHGKLTYI